MNGTTGVSSEKLQNLDAYSPAEQFRTLGTWRPFLGVTLRSRLGISCELERR